MLMPTAMKHDATALARRLATRNNDDYADRQGQLLTMKNERLVDFDLSTLARHFSFVIPEASIPNLVADTKEQAIRAMVGSLAEAGVVPHRQQDSLIAGILEREKLASTGIGRGVAIPHIRHDAVDRLVAAVAHSRMGIDFDSLDGEPVHLVFLLVSPSDSPGEHLRALEAISCHIANQEYQTWRADRRHTED